MERAARSREFPASGLFFSPRQRPSPRMESGRRVPVVWKRFVSPPADGESSVESVWGTRTRLAASPSHDKILCRCITNGGTAALQGTPWRGDTPRRGLSASSCSDWDGPQLAAQPWVRLRGDASLLGSGAPVVLSDCWQIRPRLTASVTAVTSIPSMSVASYQGK